MPCKHSATPWPASYPPELFSKVFRHHSLFFLYLTCQEFKRFWCGRPERFTHPSSPSLRSPRRIQPFDKYAHTFLFLPSIHQRFPVAILSAHLVGSSLSPEAKKFRLLADVLNDTAVILDTFSPALNAVPIPGLRVIALCLSAVFKSLCGIAAGGSKASITMHFATPIHGKGDVGDLNAKDSSKETVLALFGMLVSDSLSHGQLMLMFFFEVRDTNCAILDDAVDDIQRSFRPRRLTSSNKLLGRARPRSSLTKPTTPQHHMVVISEITLPCRSYPCADRRPRADFRKP